MAKDCIARLDYARDKQKYLLKGLLNLEKKKKINNAVFFFKKCINDGDNECMYKYGEMLFLGEGIKKDYNEAFQWFKNSKKSGFLKGEYFLTSYNSLSTLKEFFELPAETQLVLISSCIKNLVNHNGDVNSIFDQIVIRSQKTDKLFCNHSLKMQTFHKCLSKYKDIYIMIEYPSSSFKPVIDLVSKSKKKKHFFLII